MTHQPPTQETAQNVSPLPGPRSVMKARSPARRVASSGGCAKPMPSSPWRRTWDKAVVLRPGPGGEQTRTAVVDRTVAQAFAVKDWIACTAAGRIARYNHHPPRARLRFADCSTRIASGGNPRSAFADGTTALQAQHAIWGEAQVAEPGGKSRKNARQPRRVTPLVALGRRDRTRWKALSSPPDLVQAGERLREGFERAQMGPPRRPELGPVPHRRRTAAAF